MGCCASGEHQANNAKLGQTGVKTTVVVSNKVVTNSLTTVPFLGMYTKAYLSGEENGDVQMFHAMLSEMKKVNPNMLRSTPERIH